MPKSNSAAWYDIHDNVSLYTEIDSSLFAVIKYINMGSDNRSTSVIGAPKPNTGDEHSRSIRNDTRIHRD